MLVKNINLSKLLRTGLNARKTFSVVDDEDEDTQIFVAQQQIDYEKERRFLRDGTLTLLIKQRKRRHYVKPKRKQGKDMTKSRKEIKCFS